MTKSGLMTRSPNQNSVFFLYVFLLSFFFFFLLKILLDSGLRPRCITVNQQGDFDQYLIDNSIDVSRHGGVDWPMPSREALIIQ